MLAYSPQNAPIFYNAVQDSSSSSALGTITANALTDYNNSVTAYNTAADAYTNAVNSDADDATVAAAYTAMTTADATRQLKLAAYNTAVQNQQQALVPYQFNSDATSTAGLIRRPLRRLCNSRT
jgi:hypothetical protein